MTKEDKRQRWNSPLDADEDQEWWSDRDEDRPLTLDRRRHRDPEETDERREIERWQHPRRRDGRRE